MKDTCGSYDMSHDPPTIVPSHFSFMGNGSWVNNFKCNYCFLIPETGLSVFTDFLMKTKNTCRCVEPWRCVRAPRSWPLCATELKRRQRSDRSHMSTCSQQLRLGWDGHFVNVMSLWLRRADEVSDGPAKLNITQKVLIPLQWEEIKYTYTHSQSNN